MRAERETRQIQWVEKATGRTKKSRIGVYDVLARTINLFGIKIAMQKTSRVCRRGPFTVSDNQQSR